MWCVMSRWLDSYLTLEIPEFKPGQPWFGSHVQNNNKIKLHKFRTKFSVLFFNFSKFWKTRIWSSKKCWYIVFKLNWFVLGSEIFITFEVIIKLKLRKN